MLIITDTPFPLIKYHVAYTNNEGRKIKILRSSNLEEVKSALLESVDYSDEGIVIPITYIIYYEGTKVLKKDFQQASNNKTYLVVKSLKPYRSLKDKVTLMTLPLTQYQNDIAILQAIMTPECWDYYWNEYCVGRFKASPYKCYNEARYLLFLYEQKGKKKFTCEDIDSIYNKVSDKARRYTDYMYSKEGKEIILSMTTSELFLLFVRGKSHKSTVETAIERTKPNCIVAYCIFKEAFFATKLRLREAVLILHYILNVDTPLTTYQIRKLFKV